MSSSNSTYLNLSNKSKILRKIYLYYNIYIRNYKFYFKSSQLGEDTEILKYFKNVKYRGIYVDLGCYHPIRHNNTHQLFRRGWKGINIDLNPLTIELFNVARPNDINICSAISNKKSFKKLYFHHDLSPLNTLNKNHVTLLNKHFGIKNIKSKKLKTDTLSNILKKNNFRNIDFLNIDIEGLELDVLKTINFNYFSNFFAHLLFLDSIYIFFHNLKFFFFLFYIFFYIFSYNDTFSSQTFYIAALQLSVDFSNYY